MNDQQAATVAQHIAGLFPTVKPPMVKAIVQEMTSGNYNADQVLTWANWRRGESSEFNLDELRKEFEKNQPKRVRQDTSTAFFLRNTEENKQRFEADEPNRKLFTTFFESCTDVDLAELLAELTPRMDPEVQRLIAGKSPRESKYLQRLIYDYAVKTVNGIT